MICQMGNDTFMSTHNTEEARPPKLHISARHEEAILSEEENTNANRAGKPAMIEHELRGLLGKQLINMWISSRILYIINNSGFEGLTANMHCSCKS